MTRIDTEGKQILKSGILTEVRIAADIRANSLVVTAPAESMDLIAALVKQLDELPTSEAEIKVFTIVNGDAVHLDHDARRTLRIQQQQGTQQGPATSATGSRREQLGAAAILDRSPHQQHYRDGSLGGLGSRRSDPAATG